MMPSVQSPKQKNGPFNPSLCHKFWRQLHLIIAGHQLPEDARGSKLSTFFADMREYMMQSS